MRIFKRCFTSIFETSLIKYSHKNDTITLTFKGKCPSHGYKHFI